MPETPLLDHADVAVLSLPCLRTRYQRRIGVIRQLPHSLRCRGVIPIPIERVKDLHSQVLPWMGMDIGPGFGKLQRFLGTPAVERVTMQQFKRCRTLAPGARDASERRSRRLEIGEPNPNQLAGTRDPQ